MTFYKERRAVLQAPKSTDVNFVLSYNLPVHLCADRVDHIRCRRQSAGNMRRRWAASSVSPSMMRMRP